MSISRQDEYVTVRVWLPRNRKKEQTSTLGFLLESKKANRYSRIGHASLEITGQNGIYASFWPEERVNQKKQGARGTMCSLAEDKVNEGGNPNVVVSLYSLDTARIKRAFHEFEQAKLNWNIFGSSLFRDKNARNCSGLVHYLLKEGGLNMLVPYVEEIKNIGRGVLTGTKVALTAGAIASRLSKVSRPYKLPESIPFSHKHSKYIIGFGGLLMLGVIALSAFRGAKETITQVLATTPVDIANIVCLAAEKEKNKNLVPEEIVNIVRNRS